MSWLGNEVCKAKFAIKSVSAKNKVQEHPLLFSIGLMSWLPCLFSLLSLNNTVRYLSWDYKLPFSLTPRIRPSEHSILRFATLDSELKTLRGHHHNYIGSIDEVKLNLSILGHFYFFCQTWSSKKYIIYLAIVFRGKTTKHDYYFCKFNFRQYNNLGKGIQFNIFWSVLNRYFKFLFSKQGAPRVLKNYNITDPWNVLNSETIKRAAHKMQLTTPEIP